jgi:small conductance mechanosensitive channel
VVSLAAVVFMVLIELGLDVTPALASIGLVGLALGLGAQTPVKDIISGLFSVIEDQFAIGDAITVAGVSGSVGRMTLRSTHMRGLNGELLVIPTRHSQWRYPHSLRYVSGLVARSPGRTAGGR